MRSALLYLLLASCVVPGLSSSAEPELRVRQGVSDLSRVIRVPAAITQASWVARPVGAMGLAPGPVEEVLLAWYPMSPELWAALEPELGPRGAEEVPSVPPDLAEALGLTQPLKGAPVSGAAFENSFWSCVGAWALEGGVLVYMSSH